MKERGMIAGFTPDGEGWRRESAIFRDGDERSMSDGFAFRIYCDLWIIYPRLRLPLAWKLEDLRTLLDRWGTG